ncbi:MAG TPA: phytase [Acidobacteriota bacterium]|nr:phytase [Acidobacteriota bacterium]
MFTILLLAWFALLEPVADVTAALATASVPDDPDDPAIYVHPSDPARSLILGTNKVRAPGGALVVYGLDGRIRQTIDNLDRPNNVDVEYGLMLGGQPTDIAVVTERLKHRLRVFRIGPEGELTDIGSPTGLQVLEGRQGEGAEPMGISLYKRPRDGAVFAVVAPKTGPSEGYLCQYLLEDDGAGKVQARKVREFGSFSGGDSEIEAIAVDDALGYVYYSDESDGIHKYHADPDHPEAARKLARFGTEGFKADREGIGIYARDDGTGYIICTDQVEGNSEYRIFRREGAAGNPHDHSEVIKVVRGGADSTDGLEVTSQAVGPAFPNGLMVAMNSQPRNFLVFRWEDIAAAGAVKLKGR